MPRSKNLEKRKQLYFIPVMKPAFCEVTIQSIKDDYFPGCEAFLGRFALQPLRELFNKHREVGAENVRYNIVMHPNNPCALRTERADMVLGKSIFTTVKSAAGCALECMQTGRCKFDHIDYAAPDRIGSIEHLRALLERQKHIPGLGRYLLVLKDMTKEDDYPKNRGIVGQFDETSVHLIGVGYETGSLAEIRDGTERKYFPPDTYGIDIPCSYEDLRFDGYILDRELAVV